MINLNAMLFQTKLRQYLALIALLSLQLVGQYYSILASSVKKWYLTQKYYQTINYRYLQIKTQRQKLAVLLPSMKSAIQPLPNPSKFLLSKNFSLPNIFQQSALKITHIQFQKNSNNIVRLAAQGDFNDFFELLNNLNPGFNIIIENFFVQKSRVNQQLLIYLTLKLA